MSKKFNVFISYAHSDSELAKELATALNKQGASPVFIDTNNLHAGVDWASQVEESLGSSNAAVFLISNDSVYSQWISYEMGVALGRSRDTNMPIIPIFINDVDVNVLPGLFRKRQYLTFAPSVISIDEIAKQVIRVASDSEEIDI